MRRPKRSFLIQQNKGGITVDFIFGFTLIMGFAAILFALSLTLTVASISQYITFVSARALFVASHKPDDQINNSQEQYNRLVNNPILKPLFSGNWFELRDPVYIAKPGDLKQFKPDFPQIDIPPQKTDFFVGFAVTFVARMLDFQIPFYGSTSDLNDNGEGFNTVVASFLSREVSAGRCRDFSMDRLEGILKFNQDRNAADYVELDQYVWHITDNGC